MIFRYKTITVDGPIKGGLPDKKTIIQYLDKRGIWRHYPKVTKTPKR